MPTDPTNEELRTWDRQHYWHSFTQMAEYEPLIITRAQGIELEDVDGRRYLDAASSMWCTLLGHRHPRINQAIREQLDRVAHCTSLGMGADVSVRLARRLSEAAPGDLEHVFFASDGSSAIEVALKMAFQYWRQCEAPKPQKTKFLSFFDAYHGDTLGATSVAGIDRYHAVFAPLLFDVVRAPAPDPRRLDADISSDEAARQLLEETERLVAQHANELAAIIIEPLVQCAAGMVMAPTGFLRGIREIATRHNVLLIADEVAVGFGRTGKLFACEHEGVVPDFLCLGKGVTAGYLPLAATVTSSRVFDAFLGDSASGRTLFHGHTFSGNPLAAAASLACFEVLEEEGVLESLPPKIAHLGERLARIAEHPHVINARQRGLIAAFDLAADKESRTPFPLEEKRGIRLAKEALARGVWLRPRADMAYVMPPLTATHDEIDQIMDAVEAGLAVATSRE